MTRPRRRCVQRAAGRAHARFACRARMLGPSDVTKEDFEQIKTRVDIVEREVEGEKMVTRHILQQSRRNGDDLAAVKDDLATVKDDLAAIKSRLDHHDQRFDGLERRVDGLERHVRHELPRIMGDVMRDVLRERDSEG
jgi:hypothetical protein